MSVALDPRCAVDGLATRGASTLKRVRPGLCHRGPLGRPSGTRRWDEFSCRAVGILALPSGVSLVTVFFGAVWQLPYTW